MDIIQLVLFLVFVALTTIGYKKDNRNLMLLGAVAITFGFFGLEFMLGFANAIEGV
jgi:lipopolysaccharide export LptBFGC system permease protein LptF